MGDLCVTFGGGIGRALLLNVGSLMLREGQPIDQALLFHGFGCLRPALEDPIMAISVRCTNARVLLFGSDTSVGPAKLQSDS